MCAPLVDERGAQGGPSSLVGGAKAGAVIAVEVLVEEEQVAPVGVVLKGARPAMDGAASSLRVAREDVNQSLSDRSGHLAERDWLPQRTGSRDREVCSVGLG